MPSKKKLEKLKKRGLVIGEGCEILNGYEFGSEPYLVEIGNNVRITRGVNITTHDGGVWVLRHLYPELSDIDCFSRVKIGDNCHIGLNATIMPGVTIGKTALSVLVQLLPMTSLTILWRWVCLRELLRAWRSIEERVKGLFCIPR